jgi:phytoene synthase
MAEPLKQIQDPDAAEGPAELVRLRDKARWIACLMAPEHARDDLLCLHAFDLELARARDVTSQPLLAEIRLTWWQETIDQIYGGDSLRQHDVVRPLADMIKRRKLPKACFDQLIDARLEDTEEAAPSSLNNLVERATAIGAPLIMLAARILGDQDVSLAARHAGRAVGLTAFVRAIPYDLARGRVRIPIDLLAQRQLNPARVLGAQDQFGLKEAASGLLTLVLEAMAQVRRAEVPGAMRAAFYHASLAEAEAAWLARGAPNFYPEHRMIARLTWRRLLGRI